MTRRSLAVALVMAAIAPASAGAAPTGPFAQACEPAGSTAVAVCYGADVVTRDGEAYAQPDRFEPAIEAYERSWTHRALDLQYALSDDVDQCIKLHRYCLGICGNKRSGQRSFRQFLNVYAEHGPKRLVNAGGAAVLFVPAAHAERVPN